MDVRLEVKSNENMLFDVGLVRGGPWGMAHLWPTELGVTLAGSFMPINRRVLFGHSNHSTR